MDFLTNVLGSLLAALLYDASPALAAQLIKIAARVLPRNERALKEEEWLAHLHYCESKPAKISHALGCLRASVVRRIIIFALLIALRTIVLYARFSIASHLKREVPDCKSGKVNPQTALIELCAFLVVFSKLKGNKDLALSENEREAARVLATDFEPAYSRIAALIEPIRDKLPPIPKL